MKAKKQGFYFFENFRKLKKHEFYFLQTLKAKKNKDVIFLQSLKAKKEGFYFYYLQTLESLTDGFFQLGESKNGEVCIKNELEIFFKAF